MADMVCDLCGTAGYDEDEGEYTIFGWLCPECMMTIEDMASPETMELLFAG